MEEIKIPKIYFGTNNVDTILQIGCGGTGGFLVPHIARMLYTENKLKNTINYIIVDGDKVEEKNITRQNFITGDIGKYKAEVLASRYSAAFGVEIQYKNVYFNDGDLYNLLPKKYGEVLVIGCIDNHKTRQIISKDLDKPRIFSCYWIDAGNETKSGQIFIQGLNSQSCMIRMNQVFPEIEKSQDKHPDELSCAERILSGEQSLSINVMAANMLFNVIISFIKTEKIYYYQINFATNNTTTKFFLDNYNDRVSAITEQNIKQKINKFNKKLVMATTEEQF